MRTKLLAARRLKGLGPTLRFLLSLRPWDFLPDMPDVTEFTTGETMGQSTEKLARRLGIGRREQDAYAARSHRRAAWARDQGHLGREIEPVATEDLSVQEDNGIRDDTSPEILARLRPSFDPENGTLTAGNSSFLTDGAGVLVLASASRVEKKGLTPEAELRGQVMTAHDPASELLLGPAYAIPRLLEAEGIALADVDVFEIHEAFAAQILAVLDLLASEEFAREKLGRERPVGEIPMEKLNAWGGSLAIGNPFAPNGARLLSTAARRLDAENGRFAVVATCAGGGLGQAMLLERS